MSDSPADIETMTRKPQTTSHIVSFLSGGVGGVSAVLVGMWIRGIEVFI